MLQSTSISRENQEARLKSKTFDHKLLNSVILGTGMSKWEANTLVELVNELLDANRQEIKDFQTVCHCVSSKEPAGKPIEECELVRVILTTWEDEDKKDLPYKNKAASIQMRWRGIMRMTDEAREQGGLLSQEDLARILHCDSRTIRRDIAELKERGIVVATRGTIKDIGPGVTHKEIAIRHWLEDKEPTEVALQIHHSLKATENYLEKFKRVAYLRREKGFTEYEISLTAGISIASTRTFLSIYDEFKTKPFFRNRMKEIAIVGHEYYVAEGEKKSSL